MRTTGNGHVSGRTGGWLLLTVLLSAGVPAVLLVLLGRRGLDISGLLVLILLAAVIVDALLLVAAGTLSLRAVRLPRAPRQQYPPAAAVVLAGDEAQEDGLRETVTSLVRAPYLSPVQVVVACGSKHAADVAGACIDDAGVPANALVARAADSSPRSLLEAALPSVQGAFLGVFVPGQQPQRGAFAQAWVWLSHGVDLLHGAIRADNADASWMARLSAVDSAGIDAPLTPLPTRDLLPGAMSGGIFLTAALARGLVSENPDAPARLRDARDRQLAIWESVPQTLSAAWRRWVALDTASLVPFGRLLSGRSILLYRTAWRPSFVWLAPAVAATAGYRLAQVLPHHTSGVLVPVAALLFLYAFVPGVLRSTFAYILADDDLRARRGWFVAYALAWMCGLGAVRNSAARVAQLRLALTRRTDVRPAGIEQTDGGAEVEAVAPGDEPDRRDEHEPAEERAPVPAPAASLSPEARRIMETADRLPAAISTILASLDAGAGECHRLAARITELEQALAAQEARAAAIQAHGSNTIDPAALQRLQETVSAVHEHPGNVLTLFALSEQATALIRVVDGYGRLRDAIAADSAQT